MVRDVPLPGPELQKLVALELVVASADNKEPSLELLRECLDKLSVERGQKSRCELRETYYGPVLHVDTGEKDCIEKCRMVDGRYEVSLWSRQRDWPVGEAFKRTSTSELVWYLSGMSWPPSVWLKGFARAQQDGLNIERDVIPSKYFIQARGTGS